MYGCYQMPSLENPLPIGQSSRNMPSGHEHQFGGASEKGIAGYLLSAGSWLLHQRSVDHDDYIPPPNPLNTRSPSSRQLATSRVFSLTTRRPSPHTERPHCLCGRYRCQHSLPTRAASPPAMPPTVEVRQQ